MKFIPIAVLATACVLSACSLMQPDASISFETTATAYQGGAVVTAVLTNESAETIRHNICFGFLTLQRLNRQWESVQVDLGPEGNFMCTAPLYKLQPGNSAETNAWLPDDLPPGTYRLAADVEVGHNRIPVVTNAFVVELP